VLPVGAVMAIAGIARQRTRRHWRQLTVAAGLVCLAIAIVPWLLPQSRNDLLKLPTVAQTLWLSTKVRTGKISELEQAKILPESLRVAPISEQYDYKMRESLAFIHERPALYVSMGVQRFGNFWTPWRHLDWSPRHRFIDAVVSVSLILGTIASLRFRPRMMPWTTLIGCAIALTLESAFGQVDADARYRLPAEVLLIPTTSLTLAYLWMKAALSRRTRS